MRGTRSGSDWGTVVVRVERAVLLASVACSAACSNAADTSAEQTNAAANPSAVGTEPGAYEPARLADAGRVLSDATSAQASNAAAAGADGGGSNQERSNDSSNDEGTGTLAPAPEPSVGDAGADGSSNWPLPAAPGPEHAFARGGSRLGAVHFKAADAERFLHFYDHELDAECAFAKVAGASQYVCAPIVAVKVHFLDAECTQPIVLADGVGIANGAASTTFSDYVVAVPEDFVGSLVTARGGELECSVERSQRYGIAPSARGSELPELGEVTGVYEVGELFALTPDDSSTLTTVYESYEGTCQSTLAMVRIRTPADSAYRLTARGNDVLVTAQRETFDAGPEFDVDRLIASDGSWQTWALRDQLGDECELVEAGRCVPGPIAPLSHATLYAEFPCSEGAVDVLVANGPACGERYGMSTVVGETQVFDVVAADDAGYYQQHGKYNVDTGELIGYECGAVGTDWIATGEAKRKFATAQQVLLGEPSLRARNFVAPGADTGVALVRDVQFVLSDERVCDVTLFEDGIYRCHTPSPGEVDGVTYVPENRVQPLGGGVYTDDACSRPLYIEQAGANPDAPFWNVSTSFHAMVPFDGLIYQDYDGSCYPVAGTSFGNRVFAESDELPVAVPVVERVEL